MITNKKYKNSLKIIKMKLIQKEYSFINYIRLMLKMT